VQIGNQVMNIVLKILISAIVIAFVSELGKRSSSVAAILASLPLTSILAMTWLYVETKDSQKVVDLSDGIFWAVLPSLLFFVALPLLIKSGIRFFPALIASCVVMFGGYSAYVVILSKLGVKI
jgi:uncharacterized membrane protein (GlpM family)